jgi:2-polyprenyl-6-methoxyphenol hydroxylase-like FAD-dependent oxidoreductase
LAAERVAIIGAGIGGLAFALALKDRDDEVVIIERDPEPPDIEPTEAFEKWQRPGVPQFRHAHIVLARAQTLLRDRYPELHADLLRAGLELSRLEEVLPASHRDRYERQPGDRDLLHFWGRRPTFEYVLRRHVGRLPNVRFLHSAKVTGLSLEATEREVRVRGVKVSKEGAEELVAADIVVDAAGKRTKSPEWLEPHGVAIERDSRPSGFVYACRHYQLKDRKDSRPRLDGGGNLDFLGYATFYAERGSFALTFGCPVDEKELAAAMHRPEGFDALCAQLPVLKEWTSMSEVKSKVLGAGLFENRWTRYGTRGGRALLGFFPVGDSHLETNPMYGRGCSAALMQAHVLAEVLREVSDPEERLRRYYATTRTMLQPYFELSVATDRMYHMRARLSRGEPVTFGERLLNWAYEAAWMPAVQSSELVAREMVKSAQMRELSSLSTRLAVVYQLILALILTMLGRKRAAPAVAGPPRVELLKRLPAHVDDPGKSPEGGGGRAGAMEPSSMP